MLKEILVTTGRPADRIPQEADRHQAEMIVLGSWSEGFIGHGLLGSTARHVTLISRLPVLLCPTGSKWTSI